MATDVPNDPLLQVVAHLEKLDIPYAITGSVAGTFFGHNRVTVDIDMIIDLRLAVVRALVDGLEGEYYIDEPAVADAVRRGTMFNIIPSFGGPKVDLFPLTDDPFEQSKFARRTQRAWKDGQVSVVTAEDLVISKLRWAQVSHSDRQIGDVRTIMASGHSLDDEYLDYWIRKLGLEDLLDAAGSSRYNA